MVGAFPSQNKKEKKTNNNSNSNRETYTLLLTKPYYLKRKKTKPANQ